MSESQSRYGIMEELNQKKLEARKKLAEYEQVNKQKEMEYNNKTSQLKNSIENENNNFKTNHENWKLNQKINIQMKESEFAQTIETMKQEIEKRDLSYEGEHEDRLKSLQDQQTSLNKSYKNSCEINKLNEKALNVEINEIDKAITSLKEMSKEQIK